MKSQSDGGLNLFGRKLGDGIKPKPVAAKTVLGNRLEIDDSDNCSLLSGVESDDLDDMDEEEQMDDFRNAFAINVPKTRKGQSREKLAKEAKA